MSVNIVVLDGYAANPNDISWEAMGRLGTLTVYERTKVCEIVARCAEADMILTNKCPISAETMNALPRLKYVGVLATGYNIVDVAAAKEKGIAVTNIPAYSTESVAQMVFSLMMEAALHVGEHSRCVMEGQWQNNADFCFWRYPLVELSGKKLGIIGNGAIGSRVGEIARAFGMKVTAYSPSRCGREVLDEIIETSDVISLNCPLKPDNANMINKDTIARMKKGVWIINTARGGLVDEAAVSDALKNGQIGWFCADVVSKEPIEATNPLLTAPHVILTPHIAWAPFEARVRLMNIAVENVKAFLNGEQLNRVEKR